MSITIPTSASGLRAVDDEPQSPAGRTVEILDVSRGQVTHVDDFAYEGELPALELGVSRPVTGTAEQPMWFVESAESSNGARLSVRLIRRIAVLAAVFALGATAGWNWPASTDEGESASVLVAGAIELNGDARGLADGDLAVTAVVPLHNGGTVPIEVFSIELSGRPINQVGPDRTATAVHPGHWRSIPVSLTVDCRVGPPLTSSLDVQIATESGEETINTPMPSDTRSLITVWKSLCPALPRPQVER